MNQTGAIRVEYQSDSRTEVFAYAARTGAFLRVVPGRPAVASTSDGTVLVGSLDHDSIEVAGPARFYSNSVENPIPSVLALEIPRDPRFTIVRDDDTGTTYRGVFPAGSRHAEQHTMLSTHAVEYDINADGVVTAIRKYSTDDPSKVISEREIESEIHFDSWQVAPMHGGQKLVRVEPASEALFSELGLRDTIQYVRSREFELREAMLADGQLEPPGADRLSTSTKVGIVVGVVVLIAVAAIIRQRLRA